MGKPAKDDAPMPAGWITSPGGVQYPSEPWHLRGTLYLSAWGISAKDLPVLLPAGLQPALLLRHALLGTAWAAYEPGGVLAYNELMAVALLSPTRRRSISITHIWVDDPSSAAGGRALWGIPKQLAAFQIQKGNPFQGSVEKDGEAIAALRFRSGVPLPGRWRVAMRTVQMQEDSLKITEARSSVRVQFGRADWNFTANGPLGFLSGRRPLLSVRLESAEIKFGV